MVKPGLSRIIGQRLTHRKLNHLRLFIPVQMSECMDLFLRLCGDLFHISFKQSKDPLNLHSPVKAGIEFYMQDQLSVLQICVRRYLGKILLPDVYRLQQVIRDVSLSAAAVILKSKHRLKQIVSKV